MARINARDLTVQFPIFNSSHRSLKRRIIHAATGGRLAADSSNQLVVKALDSISLSLANGDRIALLGHNGSGKSTLLRTIAGVYSPTAGILELEGSLSTLLDISQGMDPEATGWENIIMRGLVMGMTLKEARSRSEEIGAFSELGRFLDLPVRTYSSGMTLRLAFSVSVATPRDIVLMDEWLSVGDSSFAEKSSEKLRHYLDTASIFILATHSRELAHDLCNKVIVLNQGKISESYNV